MADNLSQQIQDNAAGPKKVEGDQGSVEQHSLKDLIEADRYLRSTRAGARKTGLGGLRMVKFSPPRP